MQWVLHDDSLGRSMKVGSIQMDFSHRKTLGSTIDEYTQLFLTCILLFVNKGLFNNNTSGSSVAKDKAHFTVYLSSRGRNQLFGFLCNACFARTSDIVSRTTASQINVVLSTTKFRGTI